MQDHEEALSYYVVVDGRPTGPYSRSELMSMKLKPTDFVRTADMPEFKELREFPDLSVLLGVRHQYTQPQYYATLDVRLIAWGIDTFLAFFIYALVALIYIMGSEVSDNSHIPTLLVGMISVPVLKFFINSIAEGSSRQASPGKALIGIRVTDLEGGPLGYGRAFARNFCKKLGVLTIGVGFFSGFLDRRQQCLHDNVAGTLVIKSRLI